MLTLLGVAAQVDLEMLKSGKQLHIASSKAVQKEIKGLKSFEVRL